MPPEVSLSLAVLAIAVIVDQLVGEYPSALHPVVWIGKGITLALKAAPRLGWWAQFLYGALVAVGGGAICVLVVVLALHFASIHTILEVLIGAYLLKASFALHELGAAGGRVLACLEKGDLPAAREALRALCSRDPSNLDAEALTAGAIESIAENASDSVVAPLFYFLFLGVAGAVGYRFVNTLDARIGYRGEYEALGKFAARLDDVVNWIPARLTALLLLISGFLLRLDVRGGWRILRRDGGRTPSPNAGRPMAVMAGLLGVALEKPGVYVLGDAKESLSPAKLVQARRVLALTGWLMFGLTALGVCLVRSLLGEGLAWGPLR
ncbi:hypothetical protein AYO40_04020 [Planctomycetaceae bacterium SCGC AG-212-D15]|nr:hypothetical protein AYO40_04020 [Planctomycetaceae bacterium SCGC AG-212-D15]